MNLKINCFATVYQNYKSKLQIYQIELHSKTKLKGIQAYLIPNKLKIVMTDSQSKNIGYFSYQKNITHSEDKDNQ